MIEKIAGIKLTRLILLGLLCQTILVNGQEDGVRFDSTLTWNKAIQKAKAENKYLFVDFYGTWCGPCKFMTEHIFSQPVVGAYMNEHFVNLVVQTDRTAKDGGNIRSWYDDASMLTDEYSVGAVPTYLFFSPDGQIVHRLVGATGEDKNIFLAEAKNAMDAQKQNYRMIGQFTRHLQDSAFLRQSLEQAIELRDAKQSEAISNAYYQIITDPYDKDNLNLITTGAYSSHDEGFRLALKATQKSDSILGRPFAAENLLYSIIAFEEIDPLFARAEVPLDWNQLYRGIEIRYAGLAQAVVQRLHNKFGDKVGDRVISPYYAKDSPSISWEKIKSIISRDYPGYDPTRMIEREKIEYYKYKAEWKQCGDAAIDFLSKYGNQLASAEINNMIWDDIFMHCFDKMILQTALIWSKRALMDTTDKETYVYNSDTYANLLYKLNYQFGLEDKLDAIYWEQHALAKSREFQLRSAMTINFERTLEKMRKGETTWEGRNAKDLYD